MEVSKVRHVVCHALKHPDPKIGFILASRYSGYTHLNVIADKQAFMDDYQKEILEEGFLDNKGVFMTEEEALAVAITAGQHRTPTRLDKLYSLPLPLNVINNPIHQAEVNGPNAQWYRAHYVLCAAIRHKETGNFICGIRHYDNVMRSVFPFTTEAVTNPVKTWYAPEVCEQGFLSSRGKFLTRKEALELAVKAGQVEADPNKTELFSEDLY